jgi:hypothetical protein
VGFGRRLLPVVLVALLGCRAAAPQRIAIGRCDHGGRSYVGTLPFWEGPDETFFSQDIRLSTRSMAVSSTREMTGMLGEIWRGEKGLSVRAKVYPGSLIALAAEGDGRLVFFWRRLAETRGEPVFDLEHDHLYTVDLRRAVDPPLVLTLPAWNNLRGATSTVVCSGAHGLEGWIASPAGFSPVPALGGAPGAVSANAPAKWPPELCAADAACSSILFEQGLDPDVLQTDCTGSPERQTLEDHWPSSTVLHPRGTLAATHDQNWESSVRVRLRGGPVRQFHLSGTVYHLSFWDERTLLVHLAEGGADAPTHISVIVLDAERGPLGKLDLDFARARSDRASLPTLAILPDKGNGRPVLTKLDDDLILITGDGEVWTWRVSVAGCAAL